ncbi:MAG: GxxExxY protein [Luteolibacter sp.]
MEEAGLLLKEEVGLILDAAIEVHRVLGHGLLEKPYENALVRELELRGIPFQQQPRYPVDYKGVRVGEFVPDLVVLQSIVVDTKTIERITTHEVGQMLNYLRINGLRVGVILNFKNQKIEIRRIVL